MELEVLVPDWPAPRRVRALVTTRGGGTSEGPFASFNLAMHVGDDPARVAANRSLLRRHVPAEPLWLQQVHGNEVVEGGGTPAGTRGDAAVVRAPGTVLAVLTADCLPVLFCDEDATVVGIAHAGWRGLAAGVIENTVAKLGVPPSRLMAWLGPAIGPGNYEVGPEVREAFVRSDAQASSAFRPGRPGRYMADLYELARQRLGKTGIMSVHGGRFCTYTDARRFFSYRRDGETGRMASLIWLAD